MGGIQHPWGLIRGVIDINGSHISEMCKTFLFDHTEHDGWSERNINITALFVARWISQLYCKYLDGSWENPEKVLPLFHLLFPPCDQSEFWVNCNSNKFPRLGLHIHSANSHQLFPEKNFVCQKFFDNRMSCYFHDLVTSSGIWVWVHKNPTLFVIEV